MTSTPFRKVLVANRGEIALRVMRTARRLGLGTVAVYSSADADAPHVRAAGQAVAIGGALAADSYLSIPALLEAARLTGADAVHPGYGFLAENAAFARACRENGLVFVGPSAEAIDAMGDKAGAKRLMRQAGVPCIRGFEDAGASDATLAAEAEAIGYPVMIKATAGGGGRGLRLVQRASVFAAALLSARSEARSAFGSDAVILERALVGARHIEVQVFADRHGNAIHLGERDCSVQRRHQKLIEEAPAPAVDAALRERMGATALLALRAIAYEGAGTVEFLLDRSGEFHFMEMNTRLQVEHPVTEAITGLDLVEWQFRISAGEALPLAQHEVRFDGHAIEVRLLAEDPARGFMPQSGTLALWQAPQGVRIDHALHGGIEIAPYYDSMIAKVVAHGRDRESARRRLLTGLEALVVLGIATNREYLARCLAHPVFVAGDATTAFVADEAEALSLRAAGEEGHFLAVAALLLFQSAATDTRHAAGGLGSHPLAHRLAVPLRLYVFGGPVSATVTRISPRRVRVDAGRGVREFDLVEQDATTLRFICDGVLEQARFVREGDRVWFQHRGQSMRADDRTLAAPPGKAAASGDGTLRASMNGRVVAVLVRVGARVEAGQPLVTLEAMKMEHVHVAPRAGIVTAIHVATGQQVATGRAALVIE